MTENENSAAEQSSGIPTEQVPVLQPTIHELEKIAARSGNDEAKLRAEYGITQALRDQLAGDELTSEQAEKENSGVGQMSAQEYERQRGRVGETVFPNETPEDVIPQAGTPDDLPVDGPTNLSELDNNGIAQKLDIPIDPPVEEQGKVEVEEQLDKAFARARKDAHESYAESLDDIPIEPVEEAGEPAKAVETPKEFNPEVADPKVFSATRQHKKRRAAAFARLNQ